MSYKLDALDLSAAMVEIEVLHKEEATFHPLVANLSLCIAGYTPCADQAIQAFDVKIWCWYRIWHGLAPLKVPLYCATRLGQPRAQSCSRIAALYLLHHPAVAVGIAE